MSRARTCLGIALAAGLAGGSFLPAGAAELAVPAGAGALRDMIERAQDGDILRLAPGQYEGPVVVTRPLSILGNGAATVTGSGRGSVITVDAPDVVISGLTVTGSGLSHETIDAGVKLTEKALRARVENNHILDNLVGVDVHGPHDARVIGNLIEGRQDLRVNERGNGLYVWNSPGLVAEGNTVRFGRDGVFVNTSSNNTFRNNRFEHLRFAVHYMYGNDGTVEGNFSSGNDIGYALMFSGRLTVKGNVSLDDRNHGLMLNYVNDAEISGNLVRGGGEKCLFMYNANKNMVSGNRFERCQIGVHFTAGSERNTFAGNAFIANRTQVKYVGTRNLDWSTGGKGNFWSDHPAFDANADGIADTVYRPNDMMDHILWTQPAARLLAGSPAVQLIRWTQTQFPALLPGGIVDSAPLMHAPAFPEPQAAAANTGGRG